MASSDGSTRESKRLATRERLLGAAIAEFKRSGMAEADVAAIVSAAGVAHGTFFFHFPTKEHVLLELEQREEDRIARTFRQFLAKPHTLEGALREALSLVLGLERRLGNPLFKDFLALHFSQTRPPADDGQEHPLIVGVAGEIEAALGLTTLGLVPKVTRLRRNQRPHQYLREKPLSSYAEAVRGVFTALTVATAPTTSARLRFANFCSWSIALGARARIGRESR